MKKIIFVIILTIVCLLAVYFISFKKTSSPNIDWFSFKVKTKYLILFITIYLIALYCIIKK